MARGRKRKLGKREPNGQPQRLRAPERERDMQMVVLEQRAKVVPLRHVTSDRVSTVRGVMWANGMISPAEYHAAERMADVIGAMRWAISAPSPYPSSLDPNIIRAHEGDVDNFRAKKRAREKYDAAKNVLLDCGTAVYLSVMDLCGQDAMPRSVSSAKAGLRALVPHFGVQDFDDENDT